MSAAACSPPTAARHACLWFLTLFPLVTGCYTVDVSHQRLVSKPNMLFSDSTVFAYDSKVLRQTEPGAATSGGATSAGCTSCR